MNNSQVPSNDIRTRSFESLGSLKNFFNDEIGPYCYMLYYSCLTDDFGRLVGDKPTIADLSFVRYNDYAVKELLGADFDFAGRFPKTAAWHHRLMERPAVAKVNKRLSKIELPRPEQPDVYRQLNSQSLNLY